MVLVITQETFDDAVRENKEEFEMSMEEAIVETIEQFKTQAVDLSHIVTDWMMASSTSSPALVDAITKLGNLVKGPSKDPKEYIVQLVVIRTECEKGLNYQVLAGKEGAYRVITDVMLKLESDNEIIKESLRTLIILMTKHPDLLDEAGVRIIIKQLDQQKNREILTLILKWTKECCILHEMNRQHIFDADILEHLKPLLHDANSAMLRDVLGVLRALVLDDDVRLEFGRSHEHARVIASDTLCVITGLLEKFKKDEALINDLMLTLCALLVRTEFCKKVEDAGGIQVVHEAMTDFKANDKIMRQCFKVLKALAGNDECKAHIIQRGMASNIVEAMEQHKKSSQTVVMGLACIAALSLRTPDNSKAFYEAGAAEAIIEVLRLHSDNEDIQKNGSWAVRNMVSRSRDQCAKFIELGAEEIFKSALKKFKKDEYDLKAALRDLGCDVQLKEEWTGKGGRITTQAKK